MSLTGIDFSPAILQLARNWADQLGRAADLRKADALDLPFPDACFDTVVSTYALCAVTDESRAVSEMNGVLRPGGLLLLADHIEGAAWPTRSPTAPMPALPTAGQLNPATLQTHSDIAG